MIVAMKIRTPFQDSPNRDESTGELYAAPGTATR
jgi:hypothetical protein